MNTENSKANKPHKFVLNLSQRLGLSRTNKHVALQNLSIYCTWKNVSKQYKSNKLKIITPTWNDELDIQDYIFLCQISKIISNTSLKSMKH